MEKRIPQNPKYKNTQSKIDTGATVNKVRLICECHALLMAVSFGCVLTLVGARSQRTRSSSSGGTSPSAA